MQHVGSEAVPKPMRALMYWGADDHSFSPKIPVHGGASAVHASYDDANCTARSACRAAAGLPGNIMNLSMDSAWWGTRPRRSNLGTGADAALLAKHVRCSTLGCRSE